MLKGRKLFCHRICSIPNICSKNFSFRSKSIKQNTGYYRETQEITEDHDKDHNDLRSVT